MKSTTEEIRQRFDQDVERFSNLDTGQSATIDAPLVLDLIAQASAESNPGATHLLDIGCGAGNYSLKLLERLPLREITLVDLSRPMLERAKQRVTQSSSAQLNLFQGDIREFAFVENRYDVIVAAAVLHHLREEAEWIQVFRGVYKSLNPGGSFWISDLVNHSWPEIQHMMWQRYGQYLAGLKDEKYRDQVFSYVEREDTPRPLFFQLDLLRQTGFRQIEVLHKNSCFAAFGALK